MSALRILSFVAPLSKRSRSALYHAREKTKKRIEAELLRIVFTHLTKTEADVVIMRHGIGCVARTDGEINLKLNEPRDSTLAQSAADRARHKLRNLPAFQELLQRYRLQPR